MKSFRYAGRCLVRCPRSREGGVLNGGLLSSTGGVTGLLVTGVSSLCFSLISPDRAHPPGGFYTSGPVPGSGSDGVRSGVGDGGRTSVNGSSLSSLAKSSARGTTTQYSGPRRCRPRVVVCLQGSNDRGGASPTASGLAQYGFKRASFWINTCPERSSLYVWLGITSTTA